MGFLKDFWTTSVYTVAIPAPVGFSPIRGPAPTAWFYKLRLVLRVLNRAIAKSGKIELRAMLSAMLRMIKRQIPSR